MRDKYGKIVGATKSDGIIPAYAGQIVRTADCYALLQDHPRIRGTNTFCPLKKFLTEGSSPHTRDKCKENSTTKQRIGIIPAYAGQILFLRKRYGQNRDHPRIRGTNPRIHQNKHKYSGSSPHTRDKLSKNTKSSIS